MRFGNYHQTQSILRGECCIRGFTLIELMVVIVIAAILLGIAVPSFQDATLSGKLRSYSNSLVASARQARSEALKRNATVTMCVSSDGASCAGAGGWELGWIIYYTDADGDDVVLKVQEAATTGFKVNGTVTSINFQPGGLASTSAKFTVCRKTPSVGSQEREVTLSATGRASTKKTEAGACS